MYSFGKYCIDSREVFLVTAKSFSFVNYKPIVPGHVLVAPLRIVARFTDLHAEEVCDLWLAAQKVARVVQEIHKATSAVFAIQDGPDAGQTVPHVHIHILPRVKNDFACNEDIYVEIEKHERADNYMLGPIVTESSPKIIDAEDSRQPRSIEDMELEADEIKKILERPLN